MSQIDEDLHEYRVGDWFRIVSKPLTSAPSSRGAEYLYIARIIDHGPGQVDGEQMVGWIYCDESGQRSCENLGMLAGTANDAFGLEMFHHWVKKGDIVPCFKPTQSGPVLAERERVCEGW